MPREHTYCPSILIFPRGQGEYERLLGKYYVYWKQRRKHSLGVRIAMQPLYWEYLTTYVLPSISWPGIHRQAAAGLCNKTQILQIVILIQEIFFFLTGKYVLY